MNENIETITMNKCQAAKKNFINYHNFLTAFMKIVVKLVSNFRALNMKTTYIVKQNL